VIESDINSMQDSQFLKSFILFNAKLKKLDTVHCVTNEVLCLSAQILNYFLFRIPTLTLGQIQYWERLEIKYFFHTAGVPLVLWDRLFPCKVTK